jgi:hypothetical protein
MKTNIQSLIRICKKLDELGEYKESDNLFIKLSYYYQDQSDYTEERKVDFDEIEEEIKRDDKFNQVEKPNKLNKDYFALQGNTDEEKKVSIFSINNVDDATPGPAAVDPTSNSSSPSQGLAYGNASLNDYTYEETNEQNVDDGNAHLNRLPRR